MPVEPGQQLLHYRLVEQIGEGGMGVVWRALDTTLDRDVAIKLLPIAFADDAERLSRFEREARLLASLNHPNLATVFGVHDADGIRFLAMELVPGEDLAHRLQRGRLSVDETVTIARQIAGALEVAHGRGVVHRDLKPANIRITPDGTVKILDFGLAKSMLAPAGEDATLTSSGTAVGTLLGTAAYMSPEQTRGQQVDERSDIWSFGCVVWECLTGHTTFGGRTVSDSIGAILHTEPDWALLPDDTPASVQRMLQRCLVKDSRDRLHHIADARIELGSTDSEPVAPRRSSSGLKLAVVVLAIALIASVVTALLPRLQPAPEAVADNPLAGARFSKLTEFEGSELDAAISPDGRFVAFVSDRDGPFEIFVGQIGAAGYRSLASGVENISFDDARAPVRSVGFNGDGSEIWLGGGPWRRVRTVPLLGGQLRNFLGEDVVTVAWSPDGTQVVYHERVEGDPLFIADANETNIRELLAPPAGTHQHYPVWSTDGEWIYVSRGRPRTLEMDLWRIRVNGEDLEQLTRDKLDVRYPTPIDARTVLYSARDTDGAGPWLWALDTETGRSRRASVGLEQYGSVAASADGRRLVATVQDPHATLWSVPILDRVAGERDATPFAELDTTRALAPRFGGSAMFFLSSRGSGDGLWRYDDGRISEIWRGSKIALLEPAAVAPDGETLVLSLRMDDGWRLHTLDADGTQLAMLSDGVDARGAAAWSPDGASVVTGGYREGVEGLYTVPVNGATPQRIVDGEAINPIWSPDGSLIVYTGAQVNVQAPLLAVRPNGDPVELPPIELFRFGHRARFLPDGSGLIYMQGNGPSQDFWLLELSTMTSRRLTELELPATMRSFDVTPDGTQIVFDRLSEDSDIVLIELPPPL